MRVLGLILLIPLLFLGCATDSHTRKARIMLPYIHGDIGSARAAASRMRSGGKAQDKVIDALEEGYLDFLMGDFQSARDAFVYAEQTDADAYERAMISATNVSRDILSNFTNLTKLEYRAKCSDLIMLHIFKALSYLGMGNVNAYNTEMFPLHQTMQNIEQRYNDIFLKESEAVKNRMQSSGIGAQVNRMMGATPDINMLAPNTAVRNFLNPLALLMAGIARAEANDWENAKVDFNKLYMAMPTALLAGQFKRDVLRREGQEIPPELASLPDLKFNPSGGNVLVVFANGRGPALVQQAINHPLLHAAIPVPRRYFQFRAPALKCSCDNMFFSTEVMADMDEIALWEYRLGYREMITRTIISTAIKEVGSYAATHAAYHAVRKNSRYRQDAELAAILTFLATDIYRQAQNIADTRSWETLPAQFEAALLPMPKERKVYLSVDNIAWAEAAIPQDANSAIIFVHAMQNGRLTHIVFPK